MISVSGWPFPVQLSGDLRAGGDAELSIQFVPDGAFKPQERLNLCVETFAELAAAGGLAGSDISPARSDVRLAPGHGREIIANTIRWRFTTVAVDPAALTTMLNLLEAAEIQLVHVRLASEGSDVPNAVAPDCYPSRPRPPFALDYTLPSPNVNVDVTFRAPVTRAAETEITRAVDAWAMAGTLGGFRQAALSPLDSVVFPANEVVVEHDLLSLSLENVTAHDAAFDSLVAVLSSVSERVTPIRDVLIG